MKTRNRMRWIAGLLVAALALATVAPAADAGPRHRYKKARYEKKVRKQIKRAHSRHGRHGKHVVEVHRKSDGLPALAFFGGLVLGAVLSQSHDDHDHYDHMPEYDYYDPYCERPFTTLKVYVNHFRHHSHPRIVHVIAADSGNHIHTYRYYRGDWIDWEDDW